MASCGCQISFKRSRGRSIYNIDTHGNYGDEENWPRNSHCTWHCGKAGLRDDGVACNEACQVEARNESHPSPGQGGGSV